MSKEQDYYFWLGDKAEATPMTAEEFEKKIAEIRKAYDDWVNVRVPEKGCYGDD